MDAKNTLVRIKREALGFHGNNGRYKARFDIGSGSSDRVYRVSFDSAAGAGYWVCNCFGNLRHGQCKHLTAMGLQGRKSGRDLQWTKHFELNG